MCSWSCGICKSLRGAAGARYARVLRLFAEAFAAESPTTALLGLEPVDEGQLEDELIGAEPLADKALLAVALVRGNRAIGTTAGCATEGWSWRVGCVEVTGN